MKVFSSVFLVMATSIAIVGPAHAQVVALGASQTAGKGVSSEQAYPAQLESMLRARGNNVHVSNAGVSGDTTSGMLSRLDSAVPEGTRVVILQPGGNDARKGRAGDRAGNIAAIESRLRARRIRTIIVENAWFRGLPRQPDGQHLTPDGYRAIAARLLPQVGRAP